MHYTKTHGGDSYVQSLAHCSVLFRLKMRFFAAFRILLLIVTISTGLYSCSVVPITKQTTLTEKTAFSSTPVNNNLFYHPLIYQLLLDPDKVHASLLRQPTSKHLPQRTLQLLQKACNLFYLVFLLVLIMTCLALIKGFVVTNLLLQQRSRKKTFSFFSTLKRVRVLKYSALLVKNISGVTTILVRRITAA